MSTQNNQHENTAPDYKKLREAYKYKYRDSLKVDPKTDCITQNIAWVNGSRHDLVLYGDPHPEDADVLPMLQIYLSMLESAAAIRQASAKYVSVVCQNDEKPDGFTTFFPWCDSEQHKPFEMLLEAIDKEAPITVVLSVSSREITLCSWIRAEYSGTMVNKASSHSISIPANSNGVFRIEKEFLKENSQPAQLLAMMLVFRRIISDQGQFPQLKEWGNRSSGVLLFQSADIKGEPFLVARCVRSTDRPALPCVIGLTERVIQRTYVDELYPDIIRKLEEAYAVPVTFQSTERKLEQVPHYRFIGNLTVEQKTDLVMKGDSCPRTTKWPEITYIEPETDADTSLEYRFTAENGILCLTENFRGELVGTIWVDSTKERITLAEKAKAKEIEMKQLLRMDLRAVKGLAVLAAAEKMQPVGEKTTGVFLFGKGAIQWKQIPAPQHHFYTGGDMDQSVDILNTLMTSVRCELKDVRLPVSLSAPYLAYDLRMDLTGGLVRLEMTEKGEPETIAGYVYLDPQSGNSKAINLPNHIDQRQIQANIRSCICLSKYAERIAVKSNEWLLLELDAAENLTWRKMDLQELKSLREPHINQLFRKAKRDGGAFKSEDSSKAEENRRAEEAHCREEQRRAEEAHRREEQRKAEEARRREEERSAEEARRREEQRRSWIQAKCCQHCGGSFKGIFRKTCSVCGVERDY